MPDILTALTAAAVSVFRERSSPDYKLEPWHAQLFTFDDLLHEAHRRSVIIWERHSSLQGLEQQIFEGELQTIAPRPGELDPMFLHPGGGARISAHSIVTGLFAASFQQMFYLRLPNDEGTFVRTVLEGYDELRHAVRGDRVRVYLISGVAGIKLPEAVQVNTPWGVLRPAPDVPRFHFGPMMQPQATCMLAEPRLVSIVFDRAPEPRREFDPTEVSNEKGRLLFPLACALASKEGEAPAGALMTWSTLLFPFQGTFGYSYPFLPPRFLATTDLGERVEELEEWSRLIEISHVPSVDVVARRVVSAVAHRTNRDDALIDAVMAWENLVGTSTELTYRVTAALAKLLEPDVKKRRAARKSLGEVYEVRSRIVHGNVVDQSEINNSATEAIDAAVKALRLSYRRGRNWLGLSSVERADALLLEEA